MNFLSFRLESPIGYIRSHNFDFWKFSPINSHVPPFKPPKARPCVKCHILSHTGPDGAPCELCTVGLRGKEKDTRPCHFGCSSRPPTLSYQTSTFGTLGGTPDRIHRRHVFWLLSRLATKSVERFQSGEGSRVDVVSIQGAKWLMQELGRC